MCWVIFRSASKVDIILLNIIDGAEEDFIMQISYTYWKESDGMFLGYLNEFPDHWKQGVDLEELIENLADLYQTFTSGEIPRIKRVADLELA